MKGKVNKWTLSLFILIASAKGRSWGWLGLISILLITVYIHVPSLYLSFTGDDFQWWQQARMALEEPSLLLAPGGGYRPVNTWTLSLNHLLFGTNPMGYHATNLLLHLICGVLFWFLLGRFSLSLLARSAVVFLWLCSPYSLEPAQIINTRYDLILPLCWLALALIWSGPKESWNRGRLAGAIALASLTLFTVETWVVLPAFVFCFDLCLSRIHLRRALLHTLWVGIAPLIYILIYFLHPPIEKSVYYAGGLKAAVKVPHTWAVFSNLTPLYPLEFPFRSMEVLTLLMMGSLAWFGWRRSQPLMGIGFAFFLLPFLPILPVGFMTTRYTSIPLMGFLMIMCAGIRELLVSLKGWQQQLAVILVGAMVLLMLIANLAWLQGDMIDARRYADLHTKLLAEAQAFLPSLPRDRLIVAVRLENENPLLELALDSRGIPKLYYPRHLDPYGLIDWAALLSYLLEPTGGPLYVMASLDETKTSNYAVIGHIQGGFVVLPTDAPTAQEAALTWQNKLHQVRFLKPWQPLTHP
jgi:hypothetical protein